MSGDVLLADQRTADREERLVDVASTVVAASEAAVVVQPAERALNDPAFSPYSGAVHSRRLDAPALGDPRLDPESTQLGAVALGVIGAVGDERCGTELTVAADRRDAGDKLEQLGDVVAVGGGHGRRQRHPVPAADQVVFAAFAAAVDRRGPGLLAPPLARTCELSTTARDQSSWPACCNSSNST